MFLTTTVLGVYIQDSHDDTDPKAGFSSHQSPAVKRFRTSALPERFNQSNLWPPKTAQKVLFYILCGSR